ncbi:MAG: hypothetical protein N3D12_05910 [Candidatus Methanomethyliaceae archaeon]|nr:hypothetical protein [Candidatus Methanomethyliaceae archaeon]
MDQSVEAVIATIIFLSALAFSHCIIFGAYSSILSKEVEEVKTNIASMVSSSIVIENSYLCQRWSSWTPSSNPDLYGIPQKTKIWVNATYMSINDEGELLLLDMRCSGVPLQGVGTCEYDRLVLLDDDSFVLLRVVVG